MVKSRGDGLTIHFTKKTLGVGGHGLTVNATNPYSGDGLTVLSIRLSVQAVVSCGWYCLDPCHLHCYLVRKL